jgi:hypothetical protein
MNYAEAQELCIGQKHAGPVTLELRPLQSPEPDQEAGIMCRAPVVPYLNSSWAETTADGKVKAILVYTADLSKPCEMDKPSCGICAIAISAAILKTGEIIMDKRDFDRMRTTF